MQQHSMGRTRVVGYRPKMAEKGHKGKRILIADPRFGRRRSKTLDLPVGGEELSGSPAEGSDDKEPRPHVDATGVSEGGESSAASHPRMIGGDSLVVEPDGDTGVERVLRAGIRAG